MASAQTSKEVVQRGFDTLNERDRSAFTELHADDAVLYAFGKEFRGIDEIVANQFGFFEAFPDFTYAPDAIVAEGEMVAARWTAAGTHEGEFEGIEPTGKEVEFPVMGMFRVEDEQLVEVWLVADQLGLLTQLGVVEPPGE